MSTYDQLLEELKNRGKTLASTYIPKLYNALTNEEGKTPEDARGIIENDCKDLWSKFTIKLYLPEEAKDQKKIEAGKQGQKKKQEIAIENNGKSALMTKAGNDSVGQKESKNDFSENNPASLEDGIIIDDGLPNIKKDNKKQPEPFEETENWIKQYKENETNKTLLAQARQQIEDLNKKIQELSIQLVKEVKIDPELKDRQIATKDEKSNNSDNPENKVVTKPYMLEYRDQELPLICKYYYKTETFVIIRDLKKEKQMRV